MKIIKVNYNQGEYIEGCETCDYGSSYITDISVETETAIITFECDTMYDYISESDLMQFLAVDYSTEEELANKFKDTFEDSDIEITIQHKG